LDRVEKTVFLSYRRTNFPWALAIFKDLTQHGYDVFFDYNGIATGDFEQVILGNIKARAHFVVVLTPSALERCQEPGDWLRREIETALENRRNMVPLLLENFNFDMPGVANQLTGALSALKNYQGLRIPQDYFDEAMERLRSRHLNIPLTAVLHPASPSAQRAAIEQKAAAGLAPQVTKTELTAQQWFERGFSATDPDEKVSCYSEAIRLKPDFADAFFSRGNTRHEIADFDGAIVDYDEVIRLKPEYVDAFINRGAARKSKGYLKGAIRDYSEAIRLKPNYAEAFNNRGIARHDKGDLDGAMRDFEEAIRLKPDYADAFNNRGNTREAKGDLDGAMRDYEEAIRLKPDLADAFDSRGHARYTKGNIDGALQDYDEAIRLKPYLATAFHNRGDARMRKHDLDGAIRDYGEAIRLKPDYYRAFVNRAVARQIIASISEEKSKYKDAIADYQTYLDLGGGFLNGDQSEIEKIIRGLQQKL
jgi:tetratricopeptide (TPR) repeat protein